MNAKMFWKSRRKLITETLYLDTDEEESNIEHDEFSLQEMIDNDDDQLEFSDRTYCYKVLIPK